MAQKVGLVGLALALVWVGATLPAHLFAPSTDPVPARVAEWARENGLGWAVTTAEQIVYQFDPPPTGGTVTGGVPSVMPVTEASPAATGEDLATLPTHASAPMAGEGQWQPLLSYHGKVVARAAFVRPDAVHTSFLVGAVWMDPRLVHFSLHQGSEVPGGTPLAPNQLTATEQRTVLAAFNSGFQMKDANGGYWQNGTTVSPLVSGAASMVFTKDGRLTVRAWGQDETPGPDVVAVRQNLQLLIDQGEMNPQVNDPNSSAWGKTLGNSAFVWRSAIGTRPDGSIVFVIGPALNVATLAQVVHDAGAVEAMELDINKDWTSFITYTHPGPQPHKLNADQKPKGWR